MMRNRVGMLWVTIATTAGWSLSAWASPRWLRLSWTQDPSHSITITWTDGPGTGNAELRLPDNSTATTQATSIDTGSSELGSTYTATFTGLTPDTDYHYRVQSGGQWSNWTAAKTAPAPGTCTPFTFVMGGDSRGEDIFGHYQQVHWPAIIGLIASENPLFMLHSGDYVRSGGEDSQWATELDLLPALSALHPFFMSLGNHDTGPGQGDSAWFNKVFAYPTDNPDSAEDYYTFVVGNLQVVCLSTETFGMDEQIAWLDQVLTAHESQVDWKVVFFHRPVWSSGEHGSNEGDKPRAEVLLPVLEAHGVDIVLNGHDHDYERFHPSIGGYGTPRQINPLAHDNGTRGIADGVVYIVSGGAGALVNPVFNQTVAGSAFGSSHLHYIFAQLNGATLTLNVRDLGAQSISHQPSLQGDLEVVTLEKSGGLCGGANNSDAGVDARLDAGVDARSSDSAVGSDAASPDGAVQTDAVSSRDAAASLDAGMAPDASTGGSGEAESGCNCRTSGHDTPSPPLFLLLLLGLPWLLRRRRPER